MRMDYFLPLEEDEYASGGKCVSKKKDNSSEYIE